MGFHSSIVIRTVVQCLRTMLLRIWRAVSGSITRTMSCRPIDTVSRLNTLLYSRQDPKNTFNTAAYMAIDITAWFTIYDSRIDIFRGKFVTLNNAVLFYGPLSWQCPFFYRRNFTFLDINVYHLQGKFFKRLYTYKFYSQDIQPIIMENGNEKQYNDIII